MEKSRIPAGWQLARAEGWPYNTVFGPKLNFDLKSWKFETSGSVENPLSLKYEKFVSLPSVVRKEDHHCVDGWSYLGHEWEGVHLSTIIEKTKPRKEARFILVECENSITQIFPIEQDLFFAFKRNGSVLPRAGGFPLRVVAPGEFGFKSVKWVERVRFCENRERDFWEVDAERMNVYNLFQEGVENKNPWSVDNEKRMAFLRGLFSGAAQVRREKKRRANLEAKKGREDLFLCMENEIPEGGSKKFIVRGLEILLVKNKKGITAVEPLCTHAGGDLSSGKIDPDSGTVKCPLHGAIFDTSTGECVLGNYGCDARGLPPIRTYRIKKESGRIWLENKQELCEIHELES